MTFSLSSVRTLCAAAVCAATFAVASPASAAEFRIVDMQAVLADAKAAQDVGKRIESAKQKFKTYVTTKDEELRGKFKSLEENRTLLAPEDFKAKKDNFTSQIAAIQAEARQQETGLRKAHNDALLQIQNAVLGIVDNLSKEQNFDIAFPRAQVLFHKQELDITAEVISRLNKKLPSIKVDL